MVMVLLFIIRCVVSVGLSKFMLMLTTLTTLTITTNPQSSLQSQLLTVLASLVLASSTPFPSHNIDTNRTGYHSYHHASARHRVPNPLPG